MDSTFGIAEVYSVESTGLRLILPGQTEAGTKIYKCNASATFRAGDRAMVCKDSGTYVAMFPIGNPGSRRAASALTNPAGDEIVKVTTSTSTGKTMLLLGQSGTYMKMYGGTTYYGQQNVANDATVATLITALKKIGIIR